MIMVENPLSVHTLLLRQGKCAARVTSMGGWMDLAVRKLTTPPDQLAQVLHALVKSDDFQALDSSVRKAK